jgi:heme-degrading monooxygenase HmoA
MIVVVFRVRLKANVDEHSLIRANERMSELAKAMPGYISYKNFIADDGEGVSIVEFESLETLAAWHDHPEHKTVQERGRNEFFSEYHIQVCMPVRQYGWPGATES